MMGSAYENVKERFGVLMSDASFVWGKMDEREEWDSLAEVARNIGLIYEFGTRVVVGMEYIATESAKAFGEFISSGQKQGIVVDYILSKIPVVSWLKTIIRPLIVGCVDSIVGMFNSKTKDWNVTTKEKAIELIRSEAAGK
jgi:hypothetical protein